VRTARAAGIFLALAAGWTFPLVLRLESALPGEGVGDNAAFLWNFWWMREALRGGAGFFRTDHLFAPFGLDLTLHTHTALPALFGATVLRPLTTVAAQNVTIILSLALNGFAAYLLAFDRTRDWGAAIVAGLIYGGSPYISTHLLGHFNLIGAWGLPLFVLFVLRMLSGPSMRSAVGAGLVLVAIGYTDYYYLVYAALLAAGLMLAAVQPCTLVARPAPVARPLRLALSGLLAAAVVAATIIVITGGATLRLGRLTIDARGATNLLSLGWSVGACWLVLRLRPSLRRLPPGMPLGACARRVAPAVVVALAGLLPLLARLVALGVGGDYVAPRGSWRSGPGGIDLATLGLGHPLHPLTGSFTRRIHQLLGVNSVESGAWLGLAVPALVYWAARGHWRLGEARRWLWIGGAFFVWALGPWLRVGGFDTGLMLPQNLFQFVPLLSNARIPGRALVVVVLAASMLAALGLSRLRGSSRRLALPAVAIAVLIDYVPAPYPLVTLEPSALAAHVAQSAPTVVCELPMGLRDGFGMTGRFDERALLDQMAHGRPIVGGFAARIPGSVVRQYRETPVLRTFLSLSSGGPPDAADLTLTPEQVGEVLARLGIGLLIVNRAAASPELVGYVGALHTRLVAAEGERHLLAVGRESSR
jgi:hypothetical protein